MQSRYIKGKSSSEYSYPVLLQSEDKTLVVLFHSAKCGTVVHNGSKNLGWSVGEYASTFIMSCFSYFDGTIELSN